MMMETAPAAPFKMAEPDLSLELLIVPLDAPAQFGEIDKTAEPNVVRQARKPVFCGLLFLLGPFDHEPFFRPGFATIEVTPCNTKTQARKARPERDIRSLAPSDRPPSLCRETEGEVLGLDRLMRRIAAQALGRPPMARLPGLGWQRPGAGRPDRGIGQNAGDIRQFKRRDGCAQIAVGAP